MNAPTWIGWGVSVLCLPVIAWIFSNPSELGVKETRVLAAKNLARFLCWCFGALAAEFIGYMLLTKMSFSGNVCSWLLPCMTALTAIALALEFWRTHPAVAEVATDEQVKGWLRKIPTTQEWIQIGSVLAGVIIVQLISHYRS